MTYAPATYAVPAGPAPGLRYGGFWLRFVAYLIDGIILDVPISIVYGIAFASVLPSLHCSITYIGGSHAIQSVVCTNPRALAGLVVPGLLGLVLPLLYFVILWGWQGQSLGQKIFRLRVVDANTGARISYPRALLRYVGVLISLIPFGLGLMWAGWDPHKQGWHDKIAGTLVVRPL